MSSEIVPVDGIEAGLEETMAADWARIIAARTPLQMGERTVASTNPR